MILYLNALIITLDGGFMIRKTVLNAKFRVMIFMTVMFLMLSSLLYSTPLSQNGQLKVIGNQLSNECGQAVQLRGVSSHGLQWYGLASCMDYCCATESAIQYLANTAGIDIFRIAVYPDDDPTFGYISNPSGFTAQVNNLVQICEQNGIYALIDWHVMGESNPLVNLTYAQQFWSDMATAHKDRKNVIYEICNEPNYTNGDGSWTNIRTYANTIIPLIRAIDPDSVIIVGTPNWSQLGSDVVNNKLSYSNIMYTFHFYAATHDTSMLTPYINQLPIFVTEWGTTEASGAGGTNNTRADEFINIMAGNTGGPKISWCAWSWSEAPETSGMLNVGACTSENWTSLKPTGSYVMGKISSPADSFGTCSVPTPTPTSNGLTPIPTETIPATDLRLDSMTDGDDTSNICTYWYSYDDSNDCTDKDCVANPHGNSQIVPWSKDHWEDLGLPVQKFYMQQPGRNGAGDYAARITGVVTTTFLYGFTGLGLPLVEPEGPVNISTATGISFWCKSSQSRDFRLKINSPQAFGGKLDEDMYGYVFTAGTSWQKVTVDFSSLLFSQEGWGDKTVTKTMALSAVDTIQWQTEGQTGAPYNYDLWIDDVVLLNAPAALKTVAAGGCSPPTNTPTWDPLQPTFTKTPTPAYEMRVNCGGAQYTDGAGKIWQADKAFTTGSWGYEGGGGVADNSANGVAGTTDDTLYQFERWGSPFYRFTLPNGTYQVTLKFAEMYFTGTGSRIFDVLIEGVTVVDNLDIVAAVGAKTAHDVTVIVTVTDGRLDITSSATVDGALFNAISIMGYSSPVNTPTYTHTATYSRTFTRTYTRTATRTATSTATRTITRTSTPVITLTNTATNTLIATRTVTVTNTAVQTFTFTRTATQTVTRTQQPNTATNTVTRTLSATPTNSGTITTTITPTVTVTLTSTDSPTPTATTGAYLTAVINVSPDTVNTGDTITVIMQVENTGTGAASDVLPSGLVPSGTGSVTLVLAPSIAVTIPAGATASFTWIYTAASQGVVTLQASAGGIDSVGTWPVTSGVVTSNNLAIGVPLPTNTQTYTFTDTATNTPTFTHTFTATDTATDMPTQTYTNTPTDTTTDIPTETSTHTPSYTSTHTATDMPTGANTHTLTNTPAVTATHTDTATNTPTDIPAETFTHTSTYSATNTFTRTYTSTNTPTHTNTNAWTSTNTPVDTSTYTHTPTNTPENTATYTNTPENTFTPTPTLTPAGSKDLEIKDEFVFPNPYNPNLGLPFRIRASFTGGHSSVSIKVYTQSLRCVKEFTFAGSAWPGIRTMEVPAPVLLNLASGSYYFVITAEDKTGKKSASGISSLIILK